MDRHLRKILFALTAALLALPAIGSAHEAYVLPGGFFWQSINGGFDTKAFDALKNPDNIFLALEITAAVFLLIILNFLFRRTRVGNSMNRFLERFAYLGPIFVRIAIAAAFYFGARSNAFLGPELSIAQMPFAELMRIGLYASSLMILLGVFTEIAAAIGLAIFSVGFFVFGGYLVTYLNYLGELIALLLFGARTWSLDALFFGLLKNWRAAFERYKTTIVRMFYGAALIYAGITVKLLHSDLTLRVIHDWNLTQFHWLFPSDPLLVVFGAGLAEIAIGFFILVGFETRMTVLISLFYITLSLLFFRELVWPHILLYGISLNLIVEPEVFTIDNLLFRNKKAAI